MSPDIRIVADPPLPTLAALLEDNRHKLLATESMHLQRTVQHEDRLCLLFGNGVSLQVLAADNRDGSSALLGALEILDTLTDDADIAVVLLSARPPPGQRWLQRRTPFTWIRTQVLDIEGRLGLLLELHGTSAAPTRTADVPATAQRTANSDNGRGTILADSLTDEEAAFLQHL